MTKKRMSGGIRWIVTIKICEDEDVTKKDLESLISYGGLHNLNCEYEVTVKDLRKK